MFQSLPGLRIETQASLDLLSSLPARVELKIIFLMRFIDLLLLEIIAWKVFKWHNSFHLFIFFVSPLEFPPFSQTFFQFRHDFWLFRLCIFSLLQLEIFLISFLLKWIKDLSIFSFIFTFLSFPIFILDWDEMMSRRMTQILSNFFSFPFLYWLMLVSYWGFQ